MYNRQMAMSLSSVSGGVGPDGICFFIWERNMKEPRKGLRGNTVSGVSSAASPA